MTGQTEMNDVLTHRQLERCVWHIRFVDSIIRNYISEQTWARSLKIIDVAQSKMHSISILGTPEKMYSLSVCHINSIKSNC